MSRPQKYTVKVLETTFLNQKTLLLKFDAQIDFIPGQFINILVGNGKYRAYSICSSPNTKDSIEIVATVAHEGIGANYLKSLVVGYEVTFIGPAGKFRLTTPKTDKMQFLATGTGIAPFLSFLSTIESDQEIRLAWGLRSEPDVFFLDRLEALKSTLKDFKYNIHISDEQTLKFLKGRFKVLKAFNTTFYLCGNPKMVEDTAADLENSGIDRKNIVHEAFTHSK